MRPQIKLVRHGRLLMMLSLLAIGQLACSPEDPERVNPPADAQADRPHGDHNPRHGGLVLMDRDIHFEVVWRPPAEYQVYFSDAVRSALSASTVKDLVATVTCSGKPPEVIGLQVDGTIERWIGKGATPCTIPEATVRISYVYRDLPYWTDVPLTTLQSPPPKAGL